MVPATLMLRLERRRPLVCQTSPHLGGCTAAADRAAQIPKGGRACVIYFADSGACHKQAPAVAAHPANGAAYATGGESVRATLTRASQTGSLPSGDRNVTVGTLCCAPYREN